MKPNKTLDWVYKAQNQDGGISAWQFPDGSFYASYIEISGYILPTLVKWDADRDVILRCADFLLRAQNTDGSFNGLDGIPRPFDTSAVIEGLEAVYQATGTAIYRDAANRARAWCLTQVTPAGHLKNSPNNDQANIYQLRASAILGNDQEPAYWQGRIIQGAQERTHYLAYALEGLMNFGLEEQVRPFLELAYNSGCLLQPYYVDYDWRPIYADFDICASCQMAILFKRAGFKITKHVKAIQEKILDSGGVPQSTSDNRAISWGAKFWLDLQYEVAKK